MTTSPLISTHQLKLVAGNKILCTELDWQIQQGERWAILGLNGAGKTTLLHTLAGLRTADTGKVFLQGKDISLYSRRAVAQHIALLLQENHEPFPGLVMEYVLIGRHPHLKNWQWENNRDIELARDALKVVDLAGFETRNIVTLSGGERQRMAIAAVLVQQPDLFLLDEPVNHLDWHHQHKLLKTFSELVLTEGKTMIMAIHDVNLAVRYCDHVLMMFENGNVVSGPVSEIMDAANLSDLYGHNVLKITTDSNDLFVPA